MFVLIDNQDRQGGAFAFALVETDKNGNLTFGPLAPNAGVGVPAGQRYFYDAAIRLATTYRTNGTATTTDVS